MYLYPPTSGSLFGLIVRAEDGDSRSDNQQNDCPRLIGRLRQSRKRLPSPYVSDIPGHDFVHSAQSLFAQCAVIHGPLDPFSNGFRCRLGHAGRRSMSRFQRPADSLARDQGPCSGGPGPTCPPTIQLLFRPRGVISVRCPRPGRPHSWPGLDQERRNRVVSTHPWRSRP